MKTVRAVQKPSDETIIPTGYTANGWASVLSHEMNVLFQAMCYVAGKHDTKAAMKEALGSIKGLEGAFAPVDKTRFKSEESYNGYQKHLEKHKKFLERSGFTYPASLDEAIDLFVKWGLLLDQGDVWDVPVTPFPDVQGIFTLTEAERLALNHIKLEAVVHPIFSKLVLMLHEEEENTFTFTKNQLKEKLGINDVLLFEVLVKLTPYLEAPIENMQNIADDEPMSFTVVWERVYEDFLGDKNPQIVQ